MLICGSNYLQIDQAIQYWFSVGQNFCFIVIAGGIPERQHYIAGCNGGRSERIGDCQGRLRDSGGLGAVKQVPDLGCGVVILGIDRSCIEHSNGLRQIPDIAIHCISVLSQPHLDTLHLA